MEPSKSRVAWVSGRPSMTQIESPVILPRLVAETNEKLQNELPELTEKKQVLERELQTVKSEADGLLSKWLDTPEADSFVKDRLGDLTKRRKALEASSAEIERSITGIERERVDEAVIRKALATFAEVFDDLPPYQKKEMIRLVLHSAKASDTEMQLAFHGAPVDLAAQKESPGNDVSIPGDSGVWLPKRNRFRDDSTG